EARKLAISRKHCAHQIAPPLAFEREPLSFGRLRWKSDWRLRAKLLRKEMLDFLRCSFNAVALRAASVNLTDASPHFKERPNRIEENHLDRSLIEHDLIKY